MIIHPLVTAPATHVSIGNHLLQGEDLKHFCMSHQGKIVLIADEAIQDLYATSCVSFLKSQGIQVELLTIPSGEASKSQSTIESLESSLFKMQCGRDTLLLAMGGGVTTDVVGFLASIYLRGIPLILIPTTLLAMVDASIGGKTGINTSFGKNLIGSIYHPKAIFADISTLKTLPQQEWFNGLAEILKMGLISKISLWEMAKNLLLKKTPLPLPEPLLSNLIFSAMQGKISIIEQDPTEQGLRRVLNFGHTIGHALEKMSHYGLPHGEAVAIGCVAEAYLSKELRYLTDKDFEDILNTYSYFSLKLPKHYTREALLKGMFHDKKTAQGKRRFVLIDKIGHALTFDGHYCREVSDQELTSTCDWMEKHYG
jgi:3-dehydroquinate synthase